MENPMTKVYYALIRANKRTIEEVPEPPRSEVQAMLDAEKA